MLETSTENNPTPGPPTIWTSAAAQIALAFVIGGAGTALFLWLRLPLPWFLGPMSLVLIAAVVGLPVGQPTLLTTPVRALLGFAIGASFTPALFGRAGEMAVSLLLVVPLVLLVTRAGSWFFSRAAGMDPPTAYFAAVPGGVTDVVSMAADLGADARAITLAHSTRIVIIVFALPLIFQYFLHLDIGNAVPLVQMQSEHPLLDILLIAGLSAVGWLGATKAGLAGAALIGPMLLSAIAHLAGVTTAKVPATLMNAAQITLGVLLGCQFKGLTLREFVSVVTKAAVYSVFLLVAALAAAALSHWATGAAMAPALLAFTPGGQNELLLLAFLVGLDVPFVALHHLMRLGVVIVGAQLTLKRNSLWKTSGKP